MSMVCNTKSASIIIATPEIPAIAESCHMRVFNNLFDCILNASWPLTFRHMKVFNNFFDCILSASWPFAFPRRLSSL